MTSSLPENKPNPEELPNSEDDIADAESSEISGDPAEPGKTETFSPAAHDPDIDKWIGRGLKLPQVQDDGHW